ncbi:MAG: hypothetical protein C9356_17310 [Oleiphilus sp.]|nr:MAG: hypothetical protein C9356_17310 [Oleiphilus sp.]
MARPLSFDPEQKLDEAMQLFWRHGYADLSVSFLTEQLKLNRFSLYKQFGNKEQLHYQALERYGEQLYLPLLDPLSHLQGKTSVLAYLKHFGHKIGATANPGGCMINNTLLAGPSMPASSKKLAIGLAQQLRQLLRQNFEVASQQKDLSASPVDCVNFTLMTIQALLNTRKNLGPILMQNNLHFFMLQIENW